jgi:hypothetical protein
MFFTSLQVTYAETIQASLLGWTAHELLPHSIQSHALDDANNTNLFVCASRLPTWPAVGRLSFSHDSKRQHPTGAICFSCHFRVKRSQSLFLTTSRPKLHSPNSSCTRQTCTATMYLLRQTKPEGYCIKASMLCSTPKCTESSRFSSILHELSCSHCPHSHVLI